MRVKHKRVGCDTTSSPRIKPLQIEVLRWRNLDTYALAGQKSCETNTHYVCATKYKRRGMIATKEP